VKLGYKEQNFQPQMTIYLPHKSTRLKGTPVTAKQIGQTWQFVVRYNQG